MPQPSLYAKSAYLADVQSLIDGRRLKAEYILTELIPAFLFLLYNILNLGASLRLKRKMWVRKQKESKPLEEYYVGCTDYAKKRYAKQQPEEW